MFPQGCLNHGLLKNVIADVIKSCMIIHDNNYASGKTTAYDLMNVHDMGKSIPGFIMNKRWQTVEFFSFADVDQKTAAENIISSLCAHP